MNPKHKAYLALFFVALFYGLNYVIAKEVMPNYIAPRGFIFIRVVGQAPCSS